MVADRPTQTVLLSTKSPPMAVQATAPLLCRELGFADGVFRGLETVASDTALLPPWLSSLGCVGIETGIANCANVDFGSVATCGLTQQLSCTSGSGVLP